MARGSAGRSGSSKEGAGARPAPGGSPRRRAERESEQGTESRPRSSSRVAAARDRVLRSMLSPLNIVLIPRRHIEEVLDDAVRRGRMTRTDAQEMVQSLVSRGARATDDFLADVERMLGNRGDLSDLVEEPGDGAPAQSNLPIAGYDELSAAQVQDRLEDLTTAELRKLRDYEQRHANRKTVLDRIERRLR